MSGSPASVRRVRQSRAENACREVSTRELRAAVALESVAIWLAYTHPSAEIAPEQAQTPRQRLPSGAPTRCAASRTRSPSSSRRRRRSAPPQRETVRENVAFAQVVAGVLRTTWM